MKQKFRAVSRDVSLACMASMLFSVVLPNNSSAADEMENAVSGVTFVTGESGMKIPRSTNAAPKGQWHLPAGDYANSRYSELSSINTENVAKLEVASSFSTGINQGHEGQPLVVDDTLYIVTPYPNNLIALDISKPGFPQKWSFSPNPDPTAVGKACCDVVNRGAVYADDKIIYATLDDHLVAVNAEFGWQVWKTKLGEVSRGETITMAPLVVGDHVFVGNSGGEMGVRGWLKAVDLDSGKLEWTAYNSGPDADTLMDGPQFKPFYEKDQGDDLGVKTWGEEKWKMGGGTVWGWLSYDVESGHLIYGSGNPGVWNPDARPGDNKWSISVFARDPETGQAYWANQLVPHDAWDYDEIMENIVVDMPWKGEERKVILHPGRTGFMYILDRMTGELLSAEKFYPYTNWAKGYDLKTGKPDIDEEKRTKEGEMTSNICPSSTGGKEVFPSALSPRTGLLYIPAHNFCMDYKGMEVNYIAGTPYLGADVMMYPGPGDYRGWLIAWDVAGEKQKWKVEEEFPLSGGVLTTAGDLVFYGTTDGWFRALNAITGEVLWQKKLSSGIVGNPITFTDSEGQQFVAIYAGIGGWIGGNAGPNISADDPTAALGTTGAVADLKKVTTLGGDLFVFALPKAE